MQTLSKYLNEQRKEGINKQPIVFDLLNTLLDESGVYNKFYAHISEKYSLNFEPKEFIKQFFQYQREHIFANSKKPFKEIVREAYLKLVKDADAKDLDVLFNLHKDIAFLPGIKEMLVKLQQKCRFFVLTNCANDLVRLMDLPSKSLVKFEKIFTSEDNGVYKPSSKAYQIVVDYIKLPKEKIIYVSSNNWDIKKSKEFGFNVKSVEDLKQIW